MQLKGEFELYEAAKLKGEFFLVKVGMACCRGLDAK